MSWPGNYFDLQAELKSKDGFENVNICADPDQICESGYTAFLLGKFYVFVRCRHVWQSCMTHSSAIVFWTKKDKPWDESHDFDVTIDDMVKPAYTDANEVTPHPPPRERTPATSSEGP